MRPKTASQIAQAIQMLNLDAEADYTIQKLADVSGVNRRTISRNQDFIACFDFALNKGGYYKCDPMKLA